MQLYTGEGESIVVTCPYCHKPAEWVENKEIYHGRNYGNSYMCYLCRLCGAYVGCSNNTRIPLGTLADKATRVARMETHDKYLDPIWKKGIMPRAEVYKMLRAHFGHEVHVGWSNIEMCMNIQNYLKSLKLVP